MLNDLRKQEAETQQAEGLLQNACTLADPHRVHFWWRRRLRSPAAGSRCGRTPQTRDAASKARKSSCDIKRLAMECNAGAQQEYILCCRRLFSVVGRNLDYLLGHICDPDLEVLQAAHYIITAAIWLWWCVKPLPRLLPSLFASGHDQWRPALCLQRSSYRDAEHCPAPGMGGLLRNLKQFWELSSMLKIFPAQNC